jgi:LTXXQ motif family protein
MPVSRMSASDRPVKTGICLAATLILLVPLLTAEADAGGPGGMGFGARGVGGGRSLGGMGIGGAGRSLGGMGLGRSIGGMNVGGGLAGRSLSVRTGSSGIGMHSLSVNRSVGRALKPSSAGVAAARITPTGAGNRFVTASSQSVAVTGARFNNANLRAANLASVHGVLGNHVVSNVALRSAIGNVRFQGRFFGSPWPWWWGGVVIGWYGPVFWPFAYYDFFDFIFWSYAFDDFWPYAYDDVYYGMYGRYAYAAPVAVSPAAGSVRRSPARTASSERRQSGVCNDKGAELTDLPIERISEIVQPTGAQRLALDELKGANARAIDTLKAACPTELPSIPTGRLTAMENRLQAMLQAVQTVRPALETFYQSLSDEQKARFNAVAPTGDANAAGKDQRSFTALCNEKAPGVTDLPIERIARAVRPSPAQQASLDELKDASIKAAEGLKANCPGYGALTPTGRVEAMEQRLDAVLGAVKTVQPALTKFYDGLNDEQKAGFNTLRLAARPQG